MEARRLVIRNRRGLHARASARLVALAEGYDARLVVVKDGQEAVGTSIMGLMMLGAGPGDEIELRAHGRQAGMLVAAVADLVARGFGEDD